MLTNSQYLSMESNSIAEKVIKEEPSHSMDYNNEYFSKVIKNKVAVWKDGRITILNIDEIIYCAISGREVQVVTERSRYISCESLHRWEARLFSHYFFRCHRSFIVNIDRIYQINPLFNNTYNLKLKGTMEEIPVSRRYSKQLKQLFDF